MKSQNNPNGKKQFQNISNVIISFTHNFTPQLEDYNIPFQLAMHSPHPTLCRAESLQQGIDRIYKFGQLLEQLEKILFLQPISPDSTLTPQEPKYFFHKCDSPTILKDQNILKLILDIKKVVGKELFEKLPLIVAQVQNNTMNTGYLRYLYGVFRIFSVEPQFITRILIWIYSLCFGNYQKESSIFKTIISDHQHMFVLLGMHILATQNQAIKVKLVESEEISHRKMQKRFKKAMTEYIRTQQQKNHQERYEICRICETHISINLMHAHLVICQTVNEKKYLEEHIEQSGKELLDEIKKENVEYDFLDQRADTKLFFNRVFSTLGEKNIIFQIKQDELEMNEVIEQFRHHKNSLIRNTVELLEKYYQNIITKNEAIGYDSDEGLKLSQKSKLKSHKYISRNSIRLSSHSINQDSDSRKSSTGSQKNIRITDELFGKSTKALHSIEDFSIIKLLGKGAYSEVYLVRNRTTGDLFAMKVVEVESINTETLEALKKEQQIYKKISSEFAIQLFQSFSDENLHFFILQYASGGNLRHLLEQECYFDQNSARLYLANLILALQQIHRMGIIHRDLKPENIVIDEQGFLKLTDFNLAFMLTACQEAQEDVDKFFGSPDYISPEVIKSELNHPSRDIWSLGIIAYEIMIGVTPFTGMEVQEVFQNILKGEIEWPEIGQEQGMISQEAKQFIECLLQPNPYKRLGFNGIAQLKTHKFFKDINWSNIRGYSPYFVPKKEHIDLSENKELKQKLLQRKNSKSTTNFPSLGCIIRYDVLKSKSSLKAKSTRKSRFKMEKELNELKNLTSMDSFPTSHADSQKSLHSSSRSSSSVHHSETTSHSTIEMGEISNKSIKSRGHKGIIHEEAEEDYEIKISSPHGSDEELVDEKIRKEVENL